jgi:hypothetical protein
VTSRPTIVVSKAGVSYKLCKIWFGADGSFYVTVPYHPARRAVFMKMTVDYAAAQAGQWVPYDDALEVAMLDDDDARPKLSCHPDGFCQFSGQGIVSGKDEAGTPKGIGVFSSPLMKLGSGPRFSVVIQGIEAFDRQEGEREGDVAFCYADLSATPDLNGLVLDGHYFQPGMRRFIRTLADGNRYVTILHPSGIVLPLRVVLAPDKCDLPGFLGLELYATRTLFPEPAFTLNGPGEKPRMGEQGQNVADVICAAFPGPKSVQRYHDLSYRAPEMKGEPGAERPGAGSS